MMTGFVHDLRFAARTLLKSRGFTAVVLLTLALGIGANTAIFSVVNAVLLRPLPYEDPGRLVTIWQDERGRDGPEDEWFTPPNFFDVRDASQSFERVAATRGWSPNLTGDGEPEQLTGSAVSHDYFRLLRASPVLGRGFLVEEDTPDAGQVVVLSHGLWERRFGADPKIIGSSVTLNAEPHTVVGIAPANFQPLGFEAPDVEIWRPLRMNATGGCGRGCYVLQVFGRLAPGATLESASAELNTVASSLAREYPETNSGVGISLVSLKQQTVGQIRPALLVLLGAVGFVLLIACVNIASLLLGRAVAREREVAIRTALGAARGRLIRQLLTESLLLALAGGGLGLLFAFWGTDLLVGLSPPGTPRIGEVGIDAQVLGFALALSLCTGLLFCLVPALQASRPVLTRTLGDRGGGRSTAASRRTRSALMVDEIAIALTLLVGAGLLMRSFGRLIQVDVGFDPANVLVANLALPQAQYEEDPPRVAFYEQLLERVGSLPGVRGAGAISVLPLGGDDADVSFTIEGRPPPDPERVPVAQFRIATVGYFRAMGMTLLAGRVFTDRDRADAPRVAVITETMARSLWPGEDAVGKQFRPQSFGEPLVTIVGVIEDVHHFGLDQEPRPEYYFPHAQLPARTMTLVARTTGDPLGLSGTLREQVRSLDPRLPVADITTMEQLVARSVALPRLYLSLFGVFAAVALLLASIGIYGVTAFSVTRRTQEIGVRMALCARGGDVLAMIVRQAMALAGIGLGIGLVAALFLSRTLASLLYGLSPTDPLTFAGVAALLAAVALLAAYLPARRATRIEPMVALRAE
ncbi:ABC transporter permease [soil metagenome]